MVPLMLDPKFKSFCVVSSFVRNDQGFVLLKDYDKKFLYPMLVKCHEHLHHFVKSFANQDVFLSRLQFGYF
jgi:hypothetical protein